MNQELISVFQPGKEFFGGFGGNPGAKVVREEFEQLPLVFVRDPVPIAAQPEAEPPGRGVVEEHPDSDGRLAGPDELQQRELGLAG